MVPAGSSFAALLLFDSLLYGYPFSKGHEPPANVRIAVWYVLP